MPDRDDLLIQADSILSLIYHRERNALTVQTQRDVEALLPPLREATDAIIRARREAGQ